MDKIIVINIKEQIGLRILEGRKAKGLTRKALAELTDDLKPSRINNWERGIRTPGPEEIKQLAKALDLSPAYLMCLTDEKQSKKTIESFVLVPLLSHTQACDPQAHISAMKEQDQENATLVAVSLSLGKYAFALKMGDDSMMPEMRVHDLQVVDPSIAPNPGDYVVVKIAGKPEAIVCQYKKLSYTSADFELLTLNDNWPNMKVNESMQVTLIGKVVQNIRVYL